MKNVKKVSKVLCAFGVSTVLLAGVVGAASNHAYNNNSNWKGVGSVTILLITWALLQYSNKTSLALL
jgi:hypothetical protein